ncbi:MAG: guanylate kinase [Proteobacteria bacterium]|nr:guanylate kinase [Pseudomonadota bacterium]MBU1233072.1 guanylate kinase [Pseudomonadota bacterium]MBU1419232.1 guanylate kinase [Pseudomonadota bacterium]MBU1453860.1 guanylate kinase [Pseudomonadota bacterium]
MAVKGQLFILSAPSGAGKTTLLKKVMARVPGLAFSVSHTTRSPRSGEKNGVDYHFVSVQEFQAMRDQGLFLEWAEVHGNFYGTSRPAVMKQLEQGQDIILDIDVQGAAIIAKDKTVAAVSVFIAPPTLLELERRLRGRGTDSQETIELRLKNAAWEMAAAPAYDYLVINDSLEEAASTLQAVIIAERSRGHRLPTGEPIVLVKKT